MLAGESSHTGCTCTSATPAPSHACLRPSPRRFLLLKGGPLEATLAGAGFPYSIMLSQVGAWCSPLQMGWGESALRLRYSALRCGTMRSLGAVHCARATPVLGTPQCTDPRCTHAGRARGHLAV